MDIMHNLHLIGYYAVLALAVIGAVGVVSCAVLLLLWCLVRLRLGLLQYRQHEIAARNTIAAQQTKLAAEMDRMERERLEAERELILAKKRTEEAKDELRRWRIDADAAYAIAKQDAEHRQSSLLEHIAQRMQSIDEHLQARRVQGPPPASDQPTSGGVLEARVEEMARMLSDMQSKLDRILDIEERVSREASRRLLSRRAVLYPQDDVEDEGLTVDPGGQTHTRTSSPTPTMAP